MFDHWIRLITRPEKLVSYLFVFISLISYVHFDSKLLIGASKIDFFWFYAKFHPDWGWVRGTARLSMPNDLELHKTSRSVVISKKIFFWKICLHRTLTDRGASKIDFFFDAKCPKSAQNVKTIHALLIHFEAKIFFLFFQKFSKFYEGKFFKKEFFRDNTRSRRFKQF